MFKAGQKQCQIDKNRRNWCQYCRLKKCFQMKMNKNCIFLNLPVIKTLIKGNTINKLPLIIINFNIFLLVKILFICK